MASYQAPLSLGFSRQAHWSGLPFPSPKHESEKWKWSCSVVSDSLQPHGLEPISLLHPWDFSRQEYWSGLPLPSPWSEVAQSCPTLCDPMDCSLLRSSIHGIFQARVLEWGAVSFSRGSSWPRDWIQVSRTVGRHFTVWATRECSI